MMAGHLSAVALLAAAALSAASLDRAQIVVTVVTNDQQPITGLSTADFVLREGGTRIGVLSADAATDPIDVAIVVRGFDGADAVAASKAAEAVVSSVRTIAAGSRAAVSLAEPSSTTADRVVAACDALAASASDRRAVLLILKGGGEAQAMPAGRLAEASLRAHAAVWTIQLTNGGRQLGTPLEAALAEAERAGGSFRIPVTETPNVLSAATRVVDLWRAQYVVTYTWPEPMVSSFSLVTRHDAGNVLAPSWTR